ncbi:MAG: MFS transporter [Lachnospiraceae bacterium]|nr:MFS transporter [Lachnospiraceae bacterium]
MTTPNYQKTKRACYYAYLSMASVFSLPPLLFLTFREIYNISYTLLGTLVLVNFFTQLSIDLIFTFFTKYFNPQLTVRIMPLITSLGLAVYALVPSLFPEHAYIGLVLGTVIFSISAGLCEVLMSPTVAAIPSDTPEKDMSMLHSLYAWGVLMVILISTVFFNLFGRENWMYLTLFFALLPLVASYLFFTSPMPEMNLTHAPDSSGAAKRTLGMALCVACIFLGSSAENVMTNWISGYMENALHISKTLGDIFGMALFALLLGTTRTWYAKYGRNISNFLLLSMTGAFICYIIVGFSNNVMLSFAACVLTGIFTSMLWPGMLIFMEEKLPNPGVAAYALMAAGGDFGASLAPQLMGIVVDKVSVSEFAAKLASNAVSTDQIGMKAGMLVTSLFPLIGVLLLIYMRKYFSQKTS